MNKKVLVIDDDVKLGTADWVNLNPLDITVYVACSGVDGIRQAYMIYPDLVILDIMMPGMNGFEVCSRLREFSNFPIIMLSARVHENDVLHGFNVGANDYLRKPFSKTELEARVCALLRHSNHQSSNETSYISAYNDNILKIDLTARTVKIIGKCVELSPKEYDLLACLVRDQGKIISHRQLMREVWDELSFIDSSKSSLYVYYLRKKLKDGQYGHQYIRTHWGRGYWFEPRTGEKN